MAESSSKSGTTVVEFFFVLLDAQNTRHHRIHEAAALTPPLKASCSIAPYACPGLCLLFYAAGSSLIPQKEKAAFIIL